ncbi:N-acetylmuramoyl-L-alanine amidase [Nakamurella deserti]|uniref:N-acetylmuramoyl-L-alanine amidase n=1 Tax=Nakamurella deserti TaxID=2164074 RepID=UPI00197C8273|nr:N-acetylmuramoyl-L-alanine amidase [Nakamurella deserti]
MDVRRRAGRRVSGGMRARLTTVVLGGLLLVSACGSGSAAPGSGPSAPLGTPVSAAPSTTTGTAGGEVVAPPLTTASVTAAETVPATTAAPVEPTAPPEVTEVAVTTATPVPLPSPEPAPTTSISTTTTTAGAPSPVVQGDGAGRTVVLDPGHNGANGANPSIVNAEVDAGFGQRKACNTTGTSTDDGYAEHRFTWAVAQRVTALLEAQGVRVVLTRDSDDGVGPCVNERARIGNESGADAVVSIHGDGSAPGDRGFYAMTSERLPAGEDVGAASRTLAAAVRDGLVAAGAEPSNYLGSEGLWERDDLAGLNLSQVPTTMLELGNMRDSEDAAFMTSDAGQDLLAAGIAQGVLDYLAAG